MSLAAENEAIPCTIIGSGRVAASLAGAVRLYGIPDFRLDAVYARNSARAARIAPAGVQSGEVQDLETLSGIIFIAVSDDAIPDLAASLAKLPAEPGCLCCHLSGAVGLSGMLALQQKGVDVASFHPLQSFPEQADADCFNNIFISILASGEAPALSRLAEQFGSQAVMVTEAQKQKLHLSAVFASNYLVSLLRLAEQASKDIDADVLQMLRPLINTTLDNVYQTGTGAALTGPVSRGDAGTVKSHLHLIQSDQKLTQAYRVLGCVALERAQSSGRLNHEQIKALQKLLYL